MARREYSSDTKAAAMAALLAGQSVSEVARQFRIPEGTVKSWKRRSNEHMDATVASTKKEEIGELLVVYLEATIKALTAQMKVFADESYISKQPASEAAVLHGVIADKGFRLLEALDGGPDTKK